MSWVATAVVGTAVVTSYVSGEQAAGATKSAANTQAESETEALNYLKEIDALPQQYREAALTQLAGEAGIGGDPRAQEAMIERARQSPLFAAMMGSRKAGEESILRHAGATGGLRSGNVQAALYDYNVNLENRALLESYQQQKQGLQGLAGLPSLATNIAQQTSQIGATRAQGTIGAAQARQTGLGMGLETGLAAANLFI